MKARIIFAALLALALAAAPATAQGRATTAKIHIVLAVTGTPPKAPETGDQYLAGLNPTGPWIGQSGKLERWNGAAWQAKSVEIADFVFDAGAGKVYIQSGITSPANLWFGSRYIELTNGPARLDPVVNPIASDLYIDRSYSGHSLVSSAESDATWTLRSPGASGDMWGAVVRIEKFAGTAGSLTIDVDLGGTLCDKNLEIINPLVIPNTVGRILQLRVGDKSSHCNWYLDN